MTGFPRKFRFLGWRITISHIFTSHSTFLSSGLLSPSPTNITPRLVRMYVCVLLLVLFTSPFAKCRQTFIHCFLTNGKGRKFICTPIPTRMDVESSVSSALMGLHVPHSTFVVSRIFSFFARFLAHLNHVRCEQGILLSDNTQHIRYECIYVLLYRSSSLRTMNL